MSQVPRNLDALDYTALDKIEAQIKVRKAQLFQEAEAKARTMLEKMGASVGAKFEFVPPAMPGNGNGAHKVKGGKRSAKIAIKFRNPANPTETWSGRGRPARWLTALEKAGHKRDEYAVR